MPAPARTLVAAVQSCPAKNRSWSTIGGTFSLAVSA